MARIVVSQTDVIETDDYTEMLFGKWVVAVEENSQITITTDLESKNGFYCSMEFFEENENENRVNIIQRNNGEGVGPANGNIQARLWYVEDDILYVGKWVNNELVFYDMKIDYIKEYDNHYELRLQYSEDIRGVNKVLSKSGAPGYSRLHKQK